MATRKTTIREKQPNIVALHVPSPAKDRLIEIADDLEFSVSALVTAAVLLGHFDHAAAELRRWAGSPKEDVPAELRDVRSVDVALRRLAAAA